MSMKREDKIAKRKWDGRRQDNDKMEMCEKGSFERCPEEG
jgi:hypothetical protein